MEIAWKSCNTIGWTSRYDALARLCHCHFLAPTPPRTPAYLNRSNDLRRQYLPSPFLSPNKSITFPRTNVMEQYR
ncbi:hypothetical protein E4T47_09316 [Aureobasidium subglaciale]|nr:hypothetical protein E4T47_09316 [Aureobasidium subglaciale]